MSEIRNVKYLAQVMDFEGMKYERDIRPTDIDVPPISFFLDFGGSRFIFGELKHEPAEMEPGQKLALERLCDTVEAAGVKCYVLFAWHKDEGERILVARAMVKMFRTNREWHIPRQPITVGEAILKIRTTEIPEDLRKRRASLAMESVQEIKPGYVCSLCRIAEKGWNS